VSLGAHSWPHDLGDEEILERLLTLNLERAASKKAVWRFYLDTGIGSDRIKTCCFLKGSLATLLLASREMISATNSTNYHEYEKKLVKIRVNSWQI
jgi:hypothetical protein